MSKSIKFFLCVILNLCNGEQIKASPDHIFYNDKKENVVSQNIIKGCMLLNYGGQTIENSDEAYNAHKAGLSPVLQDYLEYLDFVRFDYVGLNNTNLGKTFLGVYGNKVSATKLASAQRPGVHAEILLVDKIIKDLGISSMQELISRNVKIIVKQISGTNSYHLPTCPHCHFILKELNIVINSF